MLFKTTVNAIIADFTKKVTQLEDLAQRQDDIMATNNTKIVTLNSENVTRDLEKQRALKVAGKIKELIEV